MEYSAIIKEQNNTICSNMDATRDYHTKWSKSEKERQIPYDVTYMWNLKYDTNESIYETESGAQRIDWWLPRGGVWGGMEWETGVSRCKLVYIEWTNTRSYCTAQGTIVNILWETISYFQMENMKKNVYVYITESLCCTAVINTTL